VIVLNFQQYRNLLKDLEMLPKQTTNTKADGNNGEMRSINIPANNEKILTNHVIYKYERSNLTQSSLLERYPFELLLNFV